MYIHKKRRFHYFGIKKLQAKCLLAVCSVRNPLIVLTRGGKMDQAKRASPQLVTGLGRPTRPGPCIWGPDHSPARRARPGWAFILGPRGRADPASQHGLAGRPVKHDQFLLQKHHFYLFNYINTTFYLFNYKNIIFYLLNYKNITIYIFFLGCGLGPIWPILPSPRVDGPGWAYIKNSRAGSAQPVKWSEPGRPCPLLVSSLPRSARPACFAISSFDNNLLIEKRMNHLGLGFPIYSGGNHNYQTYLHLNSNLR